MKHATAWEHRDRLYRNHFVAGPDSDDWPTLQALRARGLMYVRCEPSEDLGNMTVFAVTEGGINVLRRRKT